VASAATDPAPAVAETAPPRFLAASAAIDPAPAAAATAPPRFPAASAVTDPAWAATDPAWAAAIRLGARGIAPESGAGIARESAVVIVLGSLGATGRPFPAASAPVAITDPAWAIARDS